VFQSRPRVGRQDFNYGDGSLVSLRDLNVRRPLDGFKLILRRQEWRIDVFAAKPVVTSPGLFDDAPDHTQTFWGIWATDRKEQSFVRQLDFYYLGLDRKNAQFDQGTARERRNTLGVNAHETAGRFSLLQEGDLQFGTFGSGRLLAWKLAQACLTRFHEFGIIRFSNFREQSLVATKTRRTPPFRRSSRCFLQACTTAIWSSRMDRSTQSWPIQALLCSYRKVLRSMSTASLYGDKRRPTGCIRNPACFCARDRHRNHATLVRRRTWTSPGVWTGIPPCDSWQRIMKLGRTFAKHNQEKTQPIFR